MSAISKRAAEVTNALPSTFCMKCGREGVALCRRSDSPRIDNGEDRNTDDAPMRYEGLCEYGSPLAPRSTMSPTGCCGHNHA